MAHAHKVTSKDRTGGTTKRPTSPGQGLYSRLFRLIHKEDSLPPATPPRQSLALDPYEDFDVLATAGHNIG